MVAAVGRINDVSAFERPPRHISSISAPPASRSDTAIRTATPFATCSTITE
jgi:hypothetical protein